MTSMCATGDDCVDARSVATRVYVPRGCKRVLARLVGMRVKGIDVFDAEVPSYVRIEFVERENRPARYKRNRKSAALHFQYVDVNFGDVRFKSIGDASEIHDELARRTIVGCVVTAAHFGADGSLVLRFGSRQLVKISSLGLTYESKIDGRKWNRHTFGFYVNRSVVMARSANEILRYR